MKAFLDKELRHRHRFRIHETKFISFIGLVGLPEIVITTSVLAFQGETNSDDHKFFIKNYQKLFSAMISDNQTIIHFGSYEAQMRTIEE